MKLPFLLSLNAFILMGFGIAFALYDPIMMSFFGMPEALGEGSEAFIGYWQIAAFGRLFGAALFGFGLLLFAIRNAMPQLSTESRRGILSALVVAHGMGAFVAITQQVAVWTNAAGWVASGLFGLWVLTYLQALLTKAYDGNK